MRAPLRRAPDCSRRAQPDAQHSRAGPPRRGSCGAIMCSAESGSPAPARGRRGRRFRQTPAAVSANSFSSVPFMKTPQAAITACRPIEASGSTSLRPLCGSMIVKRPIYGPSWRCRSPAIPRRTRLDPSDPAQCARKSFPLLTVGLFIDRAPSEMTSISAFLDPRYLRLWAQSRASPSIFSLTGPRASQSRLRRARRHCSPPACNDVARR